MPIDLDDELAAIGTALRRQSPPLTLDDVERHVGSAAPLDTRFDRPGLPSISATAVRGDVAMRHRRRWVSWAAVGAVAALVVALISWRIGSDGSGRIITPVSTPSTQSQLPTTVVPTTASTSSTSTVSDGSTGSTLPTLEGTDNGGLAVADSALPAGFSVVGIDTQPAGELGSVGSDPPQVTTVIAEYSPDRSMVVASAEISVEQPMTFDLLAQQFTDLQATTIDIGGPVVYRWGQPAPSNRFVWLDGDRAVVFVPSSDAFGDAEVAAVARGLRPREDGGYDATVLPPGWEQVAVEPARRPSYGPEWTSAYKGPTATDVDEPELTITRTTKPGSPAELSLLRTNGHAVTIGGRRMIVQRGRSLGGRQVTVTWDEPDGSQVKLTYSPLDRSLDFDQLEAEAVDLAAVVQPTTSTQWDSFIDQANTTASALAQRDWLQAQLDAQGLIVSGTIETTSGHQGVPNLFVVPTTATDGSTQACEFVATKLVTCTPIGADIGPDTASIVEGNLVRIVLRQPAVRYVLRQGDGEGGSSGPTLPLLPDDGVRVGYLTLNETLPPPSCVELIDNDGNTVATLPIAGSSNSTVGCSTNGTNDTT